MDREVSIALPAHTGSVPIMRRIVEAALHRQGVGGDRAFRFLTAAAEACTNVVEHGTAPFYSVEVRVAAGACSIEVVQEGTGFPEPPSALPDGSAESGRGVAMMHALVDHVEFSGPPPGRTGSIRVLLREPLPAEPEQPADPDGPDSAEGASGSAPGATAAASRRGSGRPGADPVSVAAPPLRRAPPNAAGTAAPTGADPGASTAEPAEAGR
ncbi:ATP-binding protein [Nocardiopsis coralliicola]